MSSNLSTLLLAPINAKNFDISSPSFEYIINFDALLEQDDFISFCIFFVFSVFRILKLMPYFTSISITSFAIFSFFNAISI